MKTTLRARLFKFRLSIAGDGPNSLLAIANLDKLCRERPTMRHEIEIVDVLLNPKRALQDGVFLTPLLIKLAPGKIQQVRGTLGRPEPMLTVMGLPA